MDQAEHDEDALFAQANAWFFRFRSGEMTEDEKAEFLVWHRRDEAHRRAWDEVLALMQSLKAPAQAAHAERAPASAQLRAHRTARPRRLRIAAGALAACLATVAAVQGPVFLARYGADHVTLTGERRVVTLTDGTRVEMNSDTALALDFQMGERRVEVRRGEAFFTIAQDSRPFVVQAGHTEIRDIGTAFSVEYAGRSRVTVEEGLVDVAQPGGQPVRAGAAQMIDFGGASVSGPMQADPGSDLAWRSGQIVFRQERLEDVVAQLNRYRPGRILILNPGIADLMVSGVFDADQPARATAALESVLGVQAREITPWIVLLH